MHQRKITLDEAIEVLVTSPPGYSQLRRRSCSSMLLGGVW
jgi:hypothetical protein